MTRETAGQPVDKVAPGSTIRASIGFPADTYRTLEEIARRKKVSLAWVVREAAERYVADQWPLFRSGRS